MRLQQERNGQLIALDGVTWENREKLYTLSPTELVGYFFYGDGAYATNDISCIGEELFGISPAGLLKIDINTGKAH